MMLSLWWSTVIIIGIIYLIIRAALFYTFWRRQGIPGPCFFNLAWAWQPSTEFIWKAYLKHGKFFGGYNPLSPILVVNDIRMARELSTKELHKFPIRFSFHLGTSNLPRSLFLMEANEDWKRIRSIVTPAFTSGKLRAMVSPIGRICANFIHHLRRQANTGVEFDLKRYIGGFTMDVIACCAYGIEVDSISQPNHPVVVNARKILNIDTTVGQVISFIFPTLARWLRLEPIDLEAVNFFDNLTFRTVEKRLREAKSGKQHQDLLGLMIENANEMEGNKNGGETTTGTQATTKLKGISKEELSGQGILFFIAGFDTTHSTFDHVIYYLATYPEWQEKLYVELASAAKNADSDADHNNNHDHHDHYDLSYEVLRKLPILNAIINETLRLCPPLSVIQREAKHDCTLLDTGIRIPKHTIISIDPYVIHRLEENFTDPLSFKPERFISDDGSTAAETNPAFIPFGIGPRFCVGMRFALNELCIGLANFVLNYRVKPGPSLKLEYFNGSFLMSPKRLMVMIDER